MLGVAGQQCCVRLHGALPCEADTCLCLLVQFGVCKGLTVYFDSM